MKETIYLDHAATTPVKQEVLEAMLPFFTESFGNPSSIYSFAQDSKQALEEARETIAKGIGALDREIYFTGSGTEADNWAIKGVAESYRSKGNHIITSKVEHHAVLHACEYLEKNGFEVTYLDVDADGIVDLEQLKSSIKDTTILITIMFANNEIGTVQPIREIGRIAKERGVLFHTDAVQAIGHVPVDVNDLGVDLLSISGHKFYGPKGVGVLYARKTVKLKAFIHGGGQERGRRGGTENVPGIVGMAKAMELALADMEEESARQRELRDYVKERILEKVPYARLNGHPEKRLPNNVNISFRFIEGESLLIMLDMKGICASSGSACTSGSLDPSHVLLAIGLPHEIAHGSLRISLGESSTREDMDTLVEALVPIVEKLRAMSPLYEDFVKNNG
ncbi:cysteine desulfurase NifS [Anaerotalea alkaliphila]|uniref:Cysteine desulfurase IscS n=1 Tax=Anaerotalea alkaliphila TaxID=2662126 RepID=A0A7X5HT45_9FIRM|nr:cysteine desulfurase NifS [Anaerotalea alkaliphila]NDL66188.1 cysteine desulfurase NifS [Anaerotalea alkaliphila]